MKYLTPIGIALAAAISAPAAAQSFDGTWRVDVSTVQLPSRPMEFAIQGGTYRCVSCATPWSVSADGAFHRVAGQPYFDEAAVLAPDDRNLIVTFRKNGRMTSVVSYNVSQDGRAHSAAWRDVNVNGLMTSGEGTGERVAAGPAGAHALSGSWRQRQIANVSADAMRMTVRTQGDTLAVSYPTGESYRARFGGPAVPVQGDAANSQVAIRRIGTNGFEETTSRGGRTVSVMSATLADPATLNVVQRNALTGAETRYSARKE